MCPINSVPPPPKNSYTIFKDRVGATNLVARKSLKKYKREHIVAIS